MNDIQVSLVNPRGRVIWISAKEAPELVAKGFKHIPNPKQDYYPQYDNANPGRLTRVIEESKIKDVIELEWL